MLQPVPRPLPCPRALAWLRPPKARRFSSQLSTASFPTPGLLRALLFALLLTLGWPQLCGAQAPHARFDYFVAPDGSDTNPGTASRPFQTILRASRVALPGTTVHVAPGRYPGGFRTTMSGRQRQRIRYISTVPGGARIVPPTGSQNHTAWDNRGDYVDIVGFEVDGSQYQGGVRWTHGIYVGGSFNRVEQNHVHHIALETPCNSAGASGIGSDSYYKGQKNDIIGNLVHHIGPPGCRFAHGIYISTSGSAQNNIVHEIGGAAIQMWHDVTNNTVSRSSVGIVVGGGDFYHAKGPNDHTAVHNNIVFDNRYGIQEQGATGLNNSYRNNLVYQNSSADWKLMNGLAHTGTIAQAPQFVRYGRTGKPDFRLRGDSPAIGAGTVDRAAEVDITGRPRLSSGRIDIGAYQR